ncbi:hypothetical protein JS533_001100 [Bifidobacterium amazonense]|uniref:Uncharacterized protein n=1 Tax=Bifidobacterium amazonense TaxID=2809027 RepID=A0ABS9VS17_9BIFI|nr:hypothetical protein [Bifidobacterium amazonense]MCH9274885.1 hypothetical protein [Bifidobacterium amazonense]
MAAKVFKQSMNQAVALIAEIGGYEESNDPTPVMMGRMEGSGDDATWVALNTPLKFRGMPVWNFDVRVSVLSPLNGAVKSDTLHIQFPASSRPSYADMVPSDDGVLA